MKETHSLIDTEKQWNNKSKTNSCSVLITFYGNMNVVVKNQFSDDNRSILILEVTIDDTEYLLVNLYNANTEQEQLKTQQDLSVTLENFDRQQ